MKVFLQVGKTAVAVFWLLVLVNLLSPLNKPVDLLLNVLGGLVLLAHVVELAMFGSRLRGQANLTLQRVQVLLFGIFHLYGLPEPLPVDVAPLADPSPEPLAAVAGTPLPSNAAPGAEVEHA